MNDGIIELNSERGASLEFTSEKFDAGSYLWKRGKTIIISLIVSREKGNFKTLVDKIINRGLSVEIPNPMPAMERIVKKCGYKHTLVNDPMFGPVNVWTLEAQG